MDREKGWVEIEAVGEDLGEKALGFEERRATEVAEAEEAIW